jgi:hypothetical protein
MPGGNEFLVAPHGRVLGIVRGPGDDCFGYAAELFSGSARLYLDAAPARRYLESAAREQLARERLDSAIPEAEKRLRELQDKCQRLAACAEAVEHWIEARRGPGVSAPRNEAV